MQVKVTELQQHYKSIALTCARAAAINVHEQQKLNEK